MASPNQPLGPEELAEVFEAAQTAMVEGSDSEGWASVTVQGLDRVVASVALKDGAFAHFGPMRLSDNRLIGSQVLAQLILEAIQKAQRGALVQLHSKIVTQAPRPDPWDEYWSLPEHERPDSFEEYLAQRQSSRGGALDPEERIAADDGAGLYQGSVMRVDLDPKKIRATPPGERHDEAVAARYDRLADELARVAAVPESAVFTAADDKANPTATVTVDRGGNVVEVWLHPEVFRRVTSDRLGAVIARCAASAHQGMLDMLLVKIDDDPQG
ncbi:hypothetical protein Srot_1951 [Segniliparus rotundus DSM 44985]|uniref:Uncharacterized protein n=1 Tax=Segniliparus rotundus (strain ATCC BAA-972 / CDC 1076 / CIP 108378 / DSM 44985 / JCM 13578) TaxID=640132 RepID=D6Z8X8_SEGRD|nr:hypothetical protein [Segniliparus rotundus]ADG98408.1 hypothetical protein Srot_1951 [Segniliparus rotundus DSM 44985]